MLELDSKQTTIPKTRPGLVAFTSLLIISAVALSLAISISLIGVGEAQNALTYKKGVETLEIAEAGIEEGLIRLRDDVNYAGGTLQVGNGSSTISVSGTGSFRTITSVANLPGPPAHSRTVTVTVKRAGNSIVVLTWSEE